MAFVEIDGINLEYEWWRPREAAAESSPVVLLHEALGSVSIWRDFPQRLADALRRPVMAYSRQGYGRSGREDRPRGLDYLHREALHWLPRVLKALEIGHPVLVGHSDGASIALIYAASGLAPQPEAAVLIAPHVEVEPEAIAGIEAADRLWHTTDWPQRLARHQPDPQRVFAEWRDTWLSAAFRAWNIEAEIPKIACPVLAVQGDRDEYATLSQIEKIALGAPRGKMAVLPECGHSPHRERPDALIAEIARFLDELDELVEKRA
ncbi:MAG: alpha/beta hydrolase [Tepidiphilus sp.]|jgi:pimeloyl-ACP methyl ester carboxylesterase|nr:alpha/beta hydrolase [Tepidiphilus sp.]MDD3433192.1 alpha/beta hydrolase [Tepidiphilus sp.]